MRLQNTLNNTRITAGEQIEQTLAIDYRTYRVAKQYIVLWHVSINDCVPWHEAWVSLSSNKIVTFHLVLFELFS